MNLHLDYETRSAVDLKKTGVYRYAEDESTGLWCAAYAIDDGPVEVWHPDIAPLNLAYAMRHADAIMAHNAQFERIITGHVGKGYGLPLTPIERWRCTMVMAYALGLPGALENAAAAVGLDSRKDMAGHRLMMKMCKPRAPRKGEPTDKLLWHDSEADQIRLREYCANDVVVERELEKRLLPLKQSELELWFLDQRINDRGVFVDEALTSAATGVVKTIAERLNRKMFAASGGAVRGITDVSGLMRFCKERGLPDIESLAKDNLAALLAREDLPHDVRAVLGIRQEGAKASVAKIAALSNGRNHDGRARGFLQFHAANTGRWAGRRFQPQNLKRPEDKRGVAEAIKTILAGDPDMVELCHGPALSVIGDTIRGMVRAAPGNELTAADYSNIEGRVLAWLAGEAWKLVAFRAFDAGQGPDIYRLTYAKSFGMDVGEVDGGAKDGPQRQVGKVEELALGYQGGPGAFLIMAKGYGVDIGKSYALMHRLAPETAEIAEESFDWRGKQSGMTRETWVAAETVKLLWRAAHPAIEQLWADAERAAVMAVERPGAVVRCGRLRFKKSGSFLFMQLPSGRAMAYPYPVVMETPYFGKTKKSLTYKTIPDPLKPGKIIPEADGSIDMKWARISTYGGMIVENATQATARDILAAGMTALDAAGYPIVLHVHDEPVAEHKIGFGSEAEFRRLMTALPACYDGLPVAAGSFRAERYRK